MYLIRAEQRFGNGDGIYTVAEQTRAFNSYYDSFRNQNFFTDARAGCGSGSRSTSDRLHPAHAGSVLRGPAWTGLGYSLERTQCNSFFVGER